MSGRYQRVQIRRGGGFTLIEVIVAIGIFATVALSIVALLALGTESVAENSDRSAAYRLVGALEEKLASDGFDSVYGALRGDPDADFFFYNYAGHLTELRDDGTAVPAGEGGGASEFRKETGFREAADVLLAEDLAASTRPVFRVKLAALPVAFGEDPAGYTLPAPDGYDHAALRLHAKFFVEPAADVAGQRPLESLPEVLEFPLIIPR